MQTKSLECTNCGAGLNVPPGVESVTCGFCNTTQVVSRADGNVALQQATDKTGAELALRRLPGELNALMRRRAEREEYWSDEIEGLSLDVKDSSNRTGRVVIFGILAFLIIPAICYVIALPFFFSGENVDGRWQAIYIVAGLVIAVALTFAYRRWVNSAEWANTQAQANLKYGEAIQQRDKELQGITQEITRLNKLMEEKHRIANS